MLVAISSLSQSSRIVMLCCPDERSGNRNNSEFKLITNVVHPPRIPVEGKNQGDTKLKLSENIMQLLQIFVQRGFAILTASYHH